MNNLIKLSKIATEIYFYKLLKLKDCYICFAYIKAKQQQLISRQSQQ